jgi:molybdenum cofactor cytidylyltransferase
MVMSEQVDMLIMAAGGSRRFGSCKLLADFRGAPLLSYVLNTAIEISRRHGECMSSINLVVGGYATEIRDAVNQWGTPVNIFHCTDWALGLGHSLAFGVGQLPTENAVLIMLADQPLINAEDVERLLVSARENPQKIICAEFSSTVGVPAFFPADFKPQLLQIEGDRGAKSMLMKERETVISVSLPRAAADIDIPDDLEKSVAE